jgi:prophage regulatory protein
MYEQNHKVLTRQGVENLTTLSRATIYQKMSTGDFPAAISLGAARVGWLERDVVAWLAARPTRTTTTSKQKAA